jgi:hypothetical protein
MKWMVEGQSCRKDKRFGETATKWKESFKKLLPLFRDLSQTDFHGKATPLRPFIFLKRRPKPMTTCHIKLII